MARVYGSFMRWATPKGPPAHPVFTSQHLAPWRRSLSPSNEAYVAAGLGRNGAPKHSLKVACGSLPKHRSVPATLAVYPLRKWYMACSGESFEIGGNTPNASAVRKIT